MKKTNLSLGLTERLVTAFSLLLLALLLAASGWLWRWDQLLYDLQIDLWSKPPAQDIVIVAVDEQSLADFGRWPWPRGIHAQLIDILSQSGAKAIAMDILFAEADLHNPLGDRQLIQSVAASERVFFPVIMEEYRLGGQLVETMPMSELSRVASGLGHMHMDLDADGIARGIFLYEGLGQAYWPHMMLSLLNWLDPVIWPLKNPPVPLSNNTQSISRSDYHLIPFFGPAGHYPRYSYSQVLKGEFLEDAFDGRIVLVGVTATGLGDVLPTPVSAHGQPMSGVEINANILDALRSEETISRVEQHNYFLFTGLIVVLPFFLYPFFPTRLVPVVTVSLAMILLSVSLLWIHGFRIWFPPAVALLGLLISYPLWSWRRLELSVAYLRLELEKLHQEQQVLPVFQQPANLPTALQFLQQILPVQGWALYENHSQLLDQSGEPLEQPFPELIPGQWARHGAELWTEIETQGVVRQLGIRWPRTAVPDGRAMLLLEDFAAQFNRPEEGESVSTLEQFERRILQVEQANERLAQLRRFITLALGQMDDGLLVVDSLGRVILSNPRAASYLGFENETALVGREASTLLQALEISGEHDWESVMVRLFMEGQPIRFEAQGPEERELYLQLQPLEKESAGIFGMIINLSDIGALKQTERTRARMLNFLSHDIRSPITSLLSLTQSRLVNEGTAAQLAEQIQPLARRSLKMADDFLQLARAEAADAASFTDLDFVGVVYDAIGDVYAQAQLRGIKLETELAVDEVWLQGNLALLERALLNLLGNAIRFSPDGGRIIISLQHMGKQLECCVLDEGPGVPDALQESIFQPFTLGKQDSKRSHTGVGLGLNFVKIVAEKHNGRVRLCDSTPVGAKFCLILPCEPHPE
ncbi:MAG: CHASE2 domain-containing protein [Gammaproteobacteria bacterium]|nr:CHASE2 domain-containing protein [Gammaproteobacteria bacterium]